MYCLHLNYIYILSTCPTKSHVCICNPWKPGSCALDKSLRGYLSKGSKNDHIVQCIDRHKLSETITKLIKDELPFGGSKLFPSAYRNLRATMASAQVLRIYVLHRLSTPFWGRINITCRVKTFTAWTKKQIIREGNKVLHFTLAICSGKWNTAQEYLICPNNLINLAREAKFPD